MRRTFSIFVLILVVIFSSLPLSACGSKVIEGLEFTALENGTYAVSSYTGDEIDVIIPSEYNDIKVTAIGKEAFANSQIQSISGGNNITSIEKSAFTSCYMLNDFNIEGKITTIKEEAFSDCTNLEEIILPDTLTYLGRKAFYGCQSLKAITIPEGIKHINDYTFANCSSLKSVDLPQGLNSIFSCAFFRCESLCDITLPENLSSIGYQAFSYCNSLSNITIPPSVQLVQDNAFNTYMTITVEGSTTGWTSSWCNSIADVVYEYSNTSTPNVEIKPGTYDVEVYNYYDVIQQIYINGDELELLTEGPSFWTGKKFTYRVDGNTIYCTPTKNGYANLEMTYNEDTQSIEWNKYTFYWVSNEKNDQYIYYGG